MEICEVPGHLDLERLPLDPISVTNVRDPIKYNAGLTFAGIDPLVYGGRVLWRPYEPASLEDTLVNGQNAKGTHAGI